MSSHVSNIFNPAHAFPVKEPIAEALPNSYSISHGSTHSDAHHGADHKSNPDKRAQQQPNNNCHAIGRANFGPYKLPDEASSSYAHCSTDIPTHRGRGPQPHRSPFQLALLQALPVTKWPHQAQSEPSSIFQAQPRSFTNRVVDSRADRSAKRQPHRCPDRDSVRYSHPGALRYSLSKAH